MQYEYRWPKVELSASARWRAVDDGHDLLRDMPEDLEELAVDSRWPAVFPSPICFATTADSTRVALEKVVGASIVNRFPYVLSLSFCRRSLSSRHHCRRTFCDILERGRNVAVQFLTRGEAMNRALGAIESLTEGQTHERIAHSGLSVRAALTSSAPVFNEAYLVYEGRLVKPGKDFDERPIHDQPWVDVGSHRVYFLEIRAIQLRSDIAKGQSKIIWRSLPSWQPMGDLRRIVSAPTASPSRRAGSPSEQAPGDTRPHTGYAKGYTPDYEFPTANTVAFESDGQWNGMAVKLIPPTPESQLEVDNDRARWPCFFPSPVGMITTWSRGGVPNLMPCGSTTVVSRHPLVIAPCVSYASINDRYKPRRTLEDIRRTGHFGCGVPFLDDAVVAAIRYAGTCSIDDDPNKLANAGLAVEVGLGAPRLPALPIHFSCRVVGEVRLGTHVMFLGEVRRIRVRHDLTPENPLHWCPWPDVATGVGPRIAEGIIKDRSLPLRDVAHLPGAPIVSPQETPEAPSSIASH